MNKNLSPERHRTAAILAIGDELALGESLDTNSAWIAQRLVARGVSVLVHETVADDAALIERAFGDLSMRVDLLVSTGGLGPTDDDLTRAALAAALGERLVEDAASVANLEARFAKIGRTLLKANRGQALRPESAGSIPNDHGTAPGLAATIHAGARACSVFCLPGPPNEMRPMFERFVAPAIRSDGAHVIRVRELHEFGLPESAIPAKLSGLMERGGNPVVGTAAKSAFVTCKIRYEGSVGSADAALDDAERRVRAALDPYLFGAGDDTLASVVLGLLRERGETVATAESCTGGMVAARLTDVAGSSDVFVGGFVTYSNEMKSALLGVSDGLLDEHGAVSEPVARAMAEGAIARARDAGLPAHHALAITGIAGPTGGTPDKPVGTVWIARATDGEATEARLFDFPGDRAVVRERATMAALGVLRLRLIERTDVRLLWERA